MSKFFGGAGSESDSSEEDSSSEYSESEEESSEDEKKASYRFVASGVGWLHTHCPLLRVVTPAGAGAEGGRFPTQGHGSFHEDGRRRRQRQ